MTAPPVSFYGDFQGLASLKNDARAQDPTALKEAAKQFESLFTKMLLKSMRDANKSFGEDSLFGSEQADFYQDMFDDQISMHLSKGKGLGLADMLIRQLTTSPAAQGADADSKTSAATSSSPVAAGSSSTGAANHAPVTTSKADFVRTMWPHAEKAAREIGVDPHALLAQAALETGWGKSVPCNGSGDCSFNLFGIKAGSQWSGATVSVPTLEFEEGMPVRKFERFRSYDTAADSFRDYAGLIRNNARYEDALGTGADVASFASALQRGGYATDPAYARKIVAVAAEVRAVLGNGALKSGAGVPLTGNGGVRS
jgi:peptidoglycan hydrolase FlgJ